MYIIAGLGNPGSRYEHTRHNSGFDALDQIADKYRIQISTRKFKGLTGTGMIEGSKVLLVKPQTYMNLSGECLLEVCRYYQADPAKDLIVLCDDISLAPGQVRIRMKGSAGGHNGLKNIISLLQTQEFMRVRIGVGEKPPGYDLADYVLGYPSAEEGSAWAEGVKDAALAAAMLTTERPELVMNRFNTKKESNT